MKKSIFNSLIKISEKYYLLYNAFSDTFLILSPTLKKQWEENKPENLSTKNKTFNDLLIKGAFIVNSTLDEFLELEKKIKTIIYDENNFHLIINPTLNCNFKCWYCYETHSCSKMNKEIMDRTKKFISHTINSSFLKHFHLSFFGGEPLLYFKDIVSPLIEYTYKECQLKQKLFSLSFTSNGFLINDKILTVIKQCQKCHASFQITLDGCREDHDKVRYVNSEKGSYDTILNNVKRLIKNHIHVILRINYTSQNIDKTSKILDDLKDPIFQNNEYLTINFQRVWQDISQEKDISLLVDQTINLFKQHKLKVIYHYSDRMRNPCYADKKNEAIINYNGNIYKCTATDFDRTERYGFLNEDGNIIWENDKHQKRLNTILNNLPCQKCRIAPLCAGGCTQRGTEHIHNEYCLYNYDEKFKDKLILDKFENKFLQPNNKELIE